MYQIITAFLVIYVINVTGPGIVQSAQGKYGGQRLCQGMSALHLPVPLR